MRVGLLIPHFFMHDEIIRDSIFAPGDLAIQLANDLVKNNVDVTLFSPGFTHPNQKIKNINCDLANFKEELNLRGDTYLGLLKKHPLIFISLARQAQSELVAKAFEMANDNELDLIHVYACEEEMPLVYSKFCKKPVVFTHHEPFNYQAKYRNIFPKYKDVNWISISYSQRKSMPKDTNFIANIYHGLDIKRFYLNANPQGNYFAYFGRIIESKGVHLAISAAKKAGVKLKIAGKHYSGYGKEKYWEEKIANEIDNQQIEYIGFLNTDEEKQKFLGNANALIMPSIWDEPFGMVAIESLACGTPVIGLNSGAIPEIITDNENGFIVEKSFLQNGEIDEEIIVWNLASKIPHIQSLQRSQVRESFEKRFTLERMAKEHIEIYSRLTCK